MKYLAMRVRYRDQYWDSRGNGTVNRDEHWFPENIGKQYEDCKSL